MNHIHLKSGQMLLGEVETVIVDLGVTRAEIPGSALDHIGQTDTSIKEPIIAAVVLLLVGVAVGAATTWALLSRG